jgi:hypothetical protein
MYGRIFESMFTGSMQGSGAVVFAVWSYVIATMRADKEVGVQVELRPKNLAFYIGESEPTIEAAIAKLCEPDPESTCEAEQGRRLVPVGKFCYRVVSGPRYLAIRNEEELREYNREAKRRERLRTAFPGRTKRRRTKAQVRAENEGREKRFEEAEKNGDLGRADEIAGEDLPDVGLPGVGL